MLKKVFSAAFLIASAELSHAATILVDNTSYVFYDPSNFNEDTVETFPDRIGWIYDHPTTWNGFSSYTTGTRFAVSDFAGTNCFRNCLAWGANRTLVLSGFQPSTVAVNFALGISAFDNGISGTLQFDIFGGSGNSTFAFDWSRDPLDPRRPLNLSPFVTIGDANGLTSIAISATGNNSSRMIDNIRTSIDKMDVPVSAAVPLPSSGLMMFFCLMLPLFRKRFRNNAYLPAKKEQFLWSGQSTL